ncbi:MAG: hypothetical protein EBR82_21565 [Caulobacteraceae bacterium]|nr:hypothetical protein [Caulobacteraceae bacterium]
MSFLSDLVVAKVRELGFPASASFFGVSEALVRQWETGTKPVSLSAVDKVFVPPEKGFADASWEGKKVLLMLPWYKTTNPLTAFCLLALLDRAKMGAAMEFGDALIAHARNKLLDTLVNTGVEYGFFLDDDMVVPCGNAGWYNRYTGMALPENFAGAHTLNRLMSHGKTLVSGLYFQRKEGGKAVFYEALLDGPSGNEENRVARSAPTDLLKEVKWAGTGCLLVHRSVALDMREKMPWLAPQGPGESWHYFSSASDSLLQRLPRLEEELSGAISDFSAGGNASTLEKSMKDAQVFLREVVSDAVKTNRLQGGEDEVFGHRANACGHPTYVDFGVVCGHVGGKVYGNP